VFAIVYYYRILLTKAECNKGLCVVDTFRTALFKTAKVTEKSQSKFDQKR